MGALRKMLFWLHLSAGVIAGLVIVIMSVTGVALTYERQMVEWSGRHLRSVAPTPGASRLSAEQLIEQVRKDNPTVELSGFTLAARSDAPVVISGSSSPILVDAYSGRILGERESGGIRAFMSRMRAWHRWLAVDGDGRPTARAITGWSNLFFLLLVMSGIWIWVPKTRTWSQFKSILLFRRAYGSSKARDFNWHNVIGIWSALPLFIVVLSAVPMSFPWANDLIYRAVGEAPPARRAGGPGGPPVREGQSARPGERPAPGNQEARLEANGGRARQSEGRDGDRARRGGARPRDEQANPIDVSGLDHAIAIASAEMPGWRTITARLPRRGTDPFTLNIDRGEGGQPHLRSTLTVDRAGSIVERETFADQSLGRQIRGVMRFAHTGEVLGLAGQTVAGLVSAGAVLMAWTGFALTWRRFRGWVYERRLQQSSAATAMPIKRVTHPVATGSGIPAVTESSSRELVS